jgi:hypothetical protein
MQVNVQTFLSFCAGHVPLALIHEHNAGLEQEALLI